MSRVPSIPTVARLRVQRGVSLLFALMALVILGLGAVALTRSVDTGTLIMGNLAFHNDALVSSARGAEEAMKWLTDNQTGNKLDSNDTARGYYASSTDDLDPTATRTSPTAKLPIVNWDGKCMGLTTAQYSTCAVVPYKAVDVNGNKVQFVIQRMCDSATVAGGTNYCVRPPGTSSGTAKDRGELQPGGRLSGGQASPYYRIIVRTEGPRDTASYTETFVHF
jgi:type IV pilus assembly protein PilX